MLRIYTLCVALLASALTAQHPGYLAGLQAGTKGTFTVGQSCGLARCHLLTDVAVYSRSAAAEFRVSGSAGGQYLLAVSVPNHSCWRLGAIYNKVMLNLGAMAVLGHGTLKDAPRASRCIPTSRVASAVVKVKMPSFAIGVHMQALVQVTPSGALGFTKPMFVIVK